MAIEEKDIVVSRIHKLLALASSNNPNEAAAAMAKAQALLLQYNLSLAEVEDLQGQHDPLAKYVKENVQLASNRRWRKKLSSVLAKNNFCRHLEYRGKNTIILIGERHNIDAVLLMIRIIGPQIEHMAQASYATKGRGYVRASWINAFCHGCIETIDARLKAERAALQSTGRALVVRVDEELKQKEQQLFTKLGKPVITVVKEASAMEIGREAGHSVTWKKQISQKG